MGDWTTLSVKAQTKDRFNELKDELDDVQDAPDHSADSFLQALLDTWEAADDGYYDESDCNLESIKDQLDTIESAQANTVSAALEAAEDADASNLTYDDVVQATRKALRDELPDQVFR